MGGVHAGRPVPLNGAAAARLVMILPGTLLRSLAGTGPLVLRRDVVVGLDVLPVTLVPPVEYRARDVDRRERAGNDADEEREGEVVDHAATE